MILIILTFRYPIGNVLLGRRSEFRDGVEAVDEDAQQGGVEPVGVGFLYYNAVFKEDPQGA